MHPRCRSTISAVLGEKTGTRIARNNKGENIQVPASMTYPDYKKVYLDKSMTLEQWREKDKIRAAAEKEKFKEQEARGADIIRRLASGEKAMPNINRNIFNDLPKNDVDVIITKNFTDLTDCIGKLDSGTVRRWYDYHDKKIYENINEFLPMEEKARIAFELRNTYRTQARKLMADKAERERLEKNRPNKTFEELIFDKMSRKNMTRSQAIEDIYKTAIKSNPEVNKKFGLE